MFQPRHLLTILLLASVTLRAQDVSNVRVPWPPPRNPADSPFAKVECASYASYKVKDAMVNPKWGDFDPYDFGPRKIDFDFSGVRQLNQIPVPGIHPRIFCTPADLPDIRRRLKETRCGQEEWKNLLCYVNFMKGSFDPKADYAQPPGPVAARGELQRVPLAREGFNRDQKAAAARYQALIKGDTSTRAGGLWHVFDIEAFRCWIEDDKPAARDLAAAVSTALKIERMNRAAKPGVTTPAGGKSHAVPLDQPIAGIHLAYVYDFLFDYLTPAQRKAIHDELANGTWRHDNYGTFNEATMSRSNWATFSYWLVEVLAIEGEPGFNDLKVRGIYRGWRNLLTVGWYPSGATYEGEAKNQLGMDGVIAFAIRQKAYGFENLCGHPFLRASALNFTPKSIVPARDGCVMYDLLGGCHAKPSLFDMIGLKYLMPDNKIVDWAYHSAVGDAYEALPNRCEAGSYDPTIGGGYGDPMILALICASDFDPANDDPAKFNVGNTFFCGERALMMTRSSWDRDALMLNLHVRQANGGHPFADRNSIMVAGAGRVWAPIYGWGENGWKNIHNSEVVIDDQPQADHTPARMVDFADQPQATFAVGDAKYAWDWDWRFNETWGARGAYTLADYKNGTIKISLPWEFEPHCVDDFSFTKRPDAFLHAPLALQPDWLRLKGCITPIARKPNYPVRYAYRTAGIVRGAHPYAIVVDDMRKDDQPHDYTWYMTLEYDIQIARIERNGAHEMDIILTGSDPAQLHTPRIAIKQGTTPLPPALADAASIPAGQPMLLVRFLNYDTEPGAKINVEAKEPTILEDMPPADLAGHYSQRVRRLAVPVHAVEPGFKVLIQAYRQGQPLPATKWNKEHSSVSVAWSGQADEVGFTSTPAGRTNVAITRAGETLVNISKPVPPLADRELPRF